jgi:hypothetical protein
VSADALRGGIPRGRCGSQAREFLRAATRSDPTTPASK